MPRLADMLRPGADRLPDRHCPPSIESGILHGTETSDRARGNPTCIACISEVAAHNDTHDMLVVAGRRINIRHDICVQERAQSRRWADAHRSRSL